MDSNRVKLDEKELHKMLSDELGKPLSDAKGFLDAFKKILLEELPSSDIGIRGIGVFRVKRRKARAGYDPANKKHIKIPAKSRLVFSPGKNLKEAVL